MYSVPLWVPPRCPPPLQVPTAQCPVPLTVDVTLPDGLWHVYGGSQKNSATLLAGGNNNSVLIICIKMAADPLDMPSSVCHGEHTSYNTHSQGSDCDCDCDGDYGQGKAKAADDQQQRMSLVLLPSLYCLYVQYMYTVHG